MLLASKLCGNLSTYNDFFLHIVYAYVGLAFEDIFLCCCRSFCIPCLYIPENLCRGAVIENGMWAFHHTFRRPPTAQIIGWGILMWGKNLFCTFAINVEMFQFNGHNWTHWCRGGSNLSFKTGSILRMKTLNLKPSYKYGVGLGRNTKTIAMGYKMQCTWTWRMVAA